MTVDMVSAPATAPFSVDRDEAMREICAARERIREGGKAAGSVFVGINNNGLHSDGTRIEGETLLRTFNEDEWRRELMIYSAADLRVKDIEPFKGEITQVVTIPEIDDDPLQVRYYGLEPKEDGIWGHGPGVLDPRAHIVPEILTDTEVVWPFVYVYAEIQLMMSSSAKECDYCHAKSTGMKRCSKCKLVFYCNRGCQLRDWCNHKEVCMKVGEGGEVEELDSPPEVSTPDELECVSPTSSAPAPLAAPPSPEQRRRKMPIVDVGDAEAAFKEMLMEPTWTAPSAAAAHNTCAFTAEVEHWDTGSPDPRTASSLQIDAKQAADAGNHKEAYALMEKAISLVCASDGRSVPQAHEADYAPMREEMPSEPPSGASAYAEPKTFKPAVSYTLPNGKVHVIPAGLYTDDEFFQRTLEAQELMVSKAEESSSLSVQAMSKYADPLTRTMSQAESMEGAESLSEKIKHKAERARNVMEASLSKEASPVLEPAPAPELPGQSEIVSLGDSLADVTITPQQAKWDAASKELKEQAAALWGPK